MGVESVFIVTGYLNTKIEAVVGEDASFIYNPFYKHCNNMGSLFMAKQSMKDEPFLYMHGDIVFTEELIRHFLEISVDEKKVLHLAVDFGETDEEAMKVKITKDNLLIESNKEIAIEESAGEWTGLAIVNNPQLLFDTIEEVLREEMLNVYDTFAFTNMVKAGAQIQCHSIQDESWIEIDFIEDYEKAKRMFE